MNRTRRIATAGLLLASSLLTACGSAVPQRNVILIVIDTLRWDHVGSYGASRRDTTPALDRFAREAVRFDRAYATAPWTRPSIGSMITGLYPSSHGGTGVDVPLPNTALTLAEILSARDYTTDGVVSNWVISEKNGFAQGFDTYHESASLLQKESTSKQVTEVARTLLEKRIGQERPFFLFVHYFDPHFRYLPHAEIGWAGGEVGRIADWPTMFDLRKLASELTEAEVENLRDLYAEEIRHADTQVGDLIAAIDELGLAEQSVVAIVSDHGEEIFDRDYIGHAHSLHEELIRVPFMLRVPGVPAMQVETPVSLVGLTPTILDAAGVSHDGIDFQGSSLMPMTRGEADSEGAPLFVEVDFIPEHRIVRTSRKQGIVHGRYKLIRDLAANTLSLYDLAADPSELRDLAPERPDLVRELLPQLEAGVALSGERSVQPDRLELSDEDRVLLEELGYIDPDG
jgi:choline-sulfatase